MAAPLIVVAGILLRDRREVLIAERPEGKAWAGFWEFPGGKVESGESPLAALQRELAEELAIDVAGETFEHFYHGGRRREVEIDFYLCHLARAIEPRGLEGQRWQWLPIAELTRLPFPPPNTAVLEKLQRLF